MKYETFNRINMIFGGLLGTAVYFYFHGLQFMWPWELSLQYIGYGALIMIGHALITFAVLLTGLKQGWIKKPWYMNFTVPEIKIQVPVITFDKK